MGNQPSGQHPDPTEGFRTGVVEPPTENLIAPVWAARETWNIQRRKRIRSYQWINSVDCEDSDPNFIYPDIPSSSSLPSEGDTDYFEAKETPAWEGKCGISEDETASYLRDWFNNLDCVTKDPNLIPNSSLSQVDTEDNR